MRKYIMISIALCMIFALRAIGGEWIATKMNGSVKSVALYEDLVIVAYTNSTIACIENNTILWQLNLEEKGIPALLRSAPPYGILVLTDKGWLGLISPQNGEGKWVKLTVDINSIVRGDCDIRYSSGIAVIYVGRYAYLVELASFRKPELWDDILNKYLKCEISGDGKYALLIGFNSFCHICIETDQKLIVIKDVGTGDYVVKGTLDFVKDAAVDWTRSRLIVANWTSLLVYEYDKRELRLISRKPFPQRSEEWESWGFSPNGLFFHFTAYDERGRVHLYVFDTVLGTIGHVVLNVTAHSPIRSAISDEGLILVVAATSSGDSVYILLDSSLKVLAKGRIEGLAKPVIEAGKAAVFSDRGVVVLRMMEEKKPSPKEEPFLVGVTVIDDEGKRVSNAKVCFNFTCATTSGNGTALFQLKEGTYSVSIVHPSYTPHTVLIEVNNATTLTFRIKKLYTITVSARFNNGTIPALCGIAVKQGSDTLWKADKAVNCTASFRLTRGNYTIIISVNGQEVEIPVFLKHDANITAELEGTFLLTVTVVGKDGRVLEDATISIEDESGNLIAKIDKGEAVVALRRGTYTLKVAAAGYQSVEEIVKVDGATTIRIELEKIEEDVGREDWHLVAAIIIAVILVSAALLWIKSHKASLRTLNKSDKGGASK